MHPFAIISTVSSGLSVAIITLTLRHALIVAKAMEEGPWRYDVNRMATLRQNDLIYRVFEPLLRSLATFNRGLFAGSLPKVERDLILAGITRAWLPEEYLARMQIVALLMLPIYTMASYYAFGLEGTWLGPLGSLVTAFLLRRQLRSRALKRQQAIKRQLPFLLDLLTLLMYAGISFLQALRQAVVEFEGQPIAQEFGRTLSDMQLGKTRSDAFDSLRTRLDDDDVTALVGAILQSEQLGSPLAEVLRTQADVLRLKRSQRAETIAGEAGVNMLLPAVLVMASTVLLILGPFVLNIFVMAWEL
jgi:tight adherence protein C